MKGLEVTLMERLIQSRQGERGIVRMLTTQYRMNAAIMTWSSEALYAGRLVAGAAVAAHTLADLPQAGLEKKPGLKKKTSPVAFLGFLGYLGFLVFLYICPEEKVFWVFQFQEYFKVHPDVK
jgi:superfamily I DNA and/or RNA helicase